MYVIYSRIKFNNTLFMVSIRLIKNFKGLATYQITVLGKVDQQAMSRINNFSVSHTKAHNKTLSILTGEIADQEALSGLLNILFDHRFEVISVVKI